MKRTPKRLVVKLGSGLLTDGKGGVDRAQISHLAEQIFRLREKGCQTILVSSGAISAGMNLLRKKKRPKELADLQACATIGQPLLMRVYHQAFEEYGLCTAQILITQWDLDSRTLYRNARATLEHLLMLGHCVPIFNENDALSFEEIEMLNKFGDNDRLAAHVTLLSRASELVILTSADGLRSKPDGTGRLIRYVHKIDARIEALAGGSNSEHSVGGMQSKIHTARVMLENDIPMTIANGREPDILLRVLRREKIGTFFSSKKA